MYFTVVKKEKQKKTASKSAENFQQFANGNHNCCWLMQYTWMCVGVWWCRTTEIERHGNHKKQIGKFVEMELSLFLIPLLLANMPWLSRFDCSTSILCKCVFGIQCENEENRNAIQWRNEGIAQCWPVFSTRHSTYSTQHTCTWSDDSFIFSGTNSCLHFGRCLICL